MSATIGSTRTAALLSVPRRSSSSSFARRATAMMFARCSRARIVVIARPSPEEAPVTRTYRSRKLIGSTRTSYHGSVVVGRERCIPRVLEHAPDLRFGDTRKRQRWERVLGEEAHGGGLVARGCGSTNELAPEEELVGMKALGRVSVPELVVDGKELRGPNPIARLLLDLARSGYARRLAHVAPPARQRPAAVAPLLHEQDLVVLEDRGANVHLRGGVA